MLIELFFEGLCLFGKLVLKILPDFSYSGQVSASVGEWTSKIFSGAAYFLPMTTIKIIFFFILAVAAFRNSIRIIRFIVGLIPLPTKIEK